MKATWSMFEELFGRSIRRSSALGKSRLIVWDDGLLVLGRPRVVFDRESFLRVCRQQAIDEGLDGEEIARFLSHAARVADRVRAYGRECGGT